LHEHGDHVVLVGAVEEVRTSDHDPLLYFRGSYGRLSSG
jgi:flavin reductase (DIM6/NTAB) family NADH-FMN oxidoreductase RutF